MLGIVLAMHVFLLAFLMAGSNSNYEWTQRAAASTVTALEVHFIEPRRSLPPPPPQATSLPPQAKPDHAPRRDVAPRKIVKAEPPNAASPVEAPAPMPDAPPQLRYDTADTTMPSSSYGDPSLRSALDAGQARSAAKLPGYKDGSVVQGIKVSNPGSIRDSIRKVGDFMNCSAVEMQRNKPGGSLNQSLLKAYDEMGCKK
ncbi:hypothetical protein [Luteibacter sp. ME-Dv--P-043b]|uniref:hypothetical protein n=1 Tax=Luteibacter sp. ME-Dv--P-043b TaxID=3040291 RepID=UPI0025575594|nr:hypothetical protein [Luteibacter sp. ME-Dv--P-043b]